MTVLPAAAAAELGLADASTSALASPAPPPPPPPPVPLGLPPYKEPGFTGSVIYIDEDTFMFPTTDQDYTTGLQFTFGGRFAKSLMPPLRLLDRASSIQKVHDTICDDKSAGCHDHGYEAHTLVVGLTFFTPRKGDAGDPDCTLQEHGCVLALTRPLHDDRPYASLLYGTVARETARGKNAWLSDFTFGVIGLQLGKRLQTAYHQGWGHDVTPGGWGFQISNGGEPTLKYRVGWRRLLASKFTEPPKPPVDYAMPGGQASHLPPRKLDLTADVEANAGFYTNVQAGARLRVSPFGRIDSPFWAAQRQPVVPSLKNATDRIISEAYLWVSGGASAWAYNALLQGQFKHSEVTLPFGDAGDPHRTALNRLIWDYEAGAALRFGRRAGRVLRHVGLTYQYNRHRALFTGPHSRQHAWGGIYLGIYPDLQPLEKAPFFPTPPGS